MHSLDIKRTTVRMKKSTCVYTFSIVLMAVTVPLGMPNKCKN